MNSIYDYPEIYLAVLEKSEEVIHQEVDTILRLLEMHQIQRGKVIDFGCRPAPHGLLLAESGFQVTAVDSSPAMLAEVRRQAERRGVQVSAVQAGEVDFDLEESDFEAAIFMFETFPQITQLAEIGRNFSAMRRHLKTGGIYIVDVDSLSHGILQEGNVRNRKTILLKNGYAERWFEDLPGDWEEGTNCEILYTRAMLDGELHETRDEWHYRMYTPWDLSLLACGMEGWKFSGAYSWRGPHLRLTNETHYFGVYQKIG